MKLYEMEIGETDVLIVELTKKSNDFVFAPKNQGDDFKEFQEEFEDPLDNQNLNAMEESKFSLNDINSLDLSKVVKQKSRGGIIGLKNIGNTCYMNSAL